MAKKKFFWQKKKDYYEFPLGLRILGGVWSVLWTGVKVAFGACVVALAVVFVTGGIFACLPAIDRRTVDAGFPLLPD